VLQECVGRDPAPLLARLAANAGESLGAARAEREVARAFLSRGPSGDVVVHRGWARLPAGLRREALRQPLRALRGDAQPPSRAEVERLDRLLRGKGVESVRGVRVRTLPDGSSAVSRRGTESPSPAVPRLRVAERPAGNEVFLERLRARSGRMEIADAGTVRTPLTVRLPLPGDVFQPFGRDRPQRLAHYLQRRGVGADDRAAVPLVCDADGIVWVVGHGLAARAAVTAATTRVLAMSC
jgi:tRNA(Ile)-lysidine synthase